MEEKNTEMLLKLVFFCLPPIELSGRGLFMKNPITLIAFGLGMVNTLNWVNLKFVDIPFVADLLEGVLNLSSWNKDTKLRNRRNLLHF